MSDPFEELKQVASTSRSLIPIRRESDLNDAERKLRIDYVNRIKARYAHLDISRMTNALKESVVQ